MAPTPPAQDEPSTSIIRRHTTGALPIARDDTQTRYIPRARPVSIPGGAPPAAALPGPRTAVLATTASILSGWATAVIATDLIAGWWRSDQLFCVALGFLTAISAAATIGGVSSLLLRRRNGRLLIVVGAVMGGLVFGSLLLTGATVHPIVYAMPVLPIAAIVLALLPATGRWLTPPRPPRFRSA